MSFNGFKLAAFADESDNKFVGQLDALLRNGLDALEMRNVDGKKNVVIDSNGSKFICRGKMTPFSTFNSENITFKILQLTMPTLPLLKWKCLKSTTSPMFKSTS